EVMLSESQERMLLVAERGREQEVMRIFEKWDLHAEPIGTVTAGRRLRVFHDGVLEADVPNEALTDDAPLYDRPWTEPVNPAAAARNVACSGAVPIGATNCLNFGNPEKPEVMGQLVKAIQGMGEACRTLDIPITGGNVSLYNETDGRAIYPTPVMGVVGLLEDADTVLRRWFVEEGDLVYLLGTTGEDLGGSELLKVVHGKIAGRPPRLDLDAEKRLHALLDEGAALGILR